jgi:hypothetical protein
VTLLGGVRLLQTQNTLKQNVNSGSQ